MKILRRHKTGIPKKYVYIAALLFSLAVIIQVSSAGLFLSRIVLFGAIYIFWAVCIDYLNALVQPFEKEKSIFFQIIERFISSFLLVLLNLAVTNILYYAMLISFMNMTLSEAYLDFEPYIIKSIFIRFFDVIIIGFILKIILAYQTLQQQKLKVISLENQLHISQLETLRNQLDPHFLFNTLHTLNTLIGYDDKKARSMVIKVTNLLRKILDKRAQQLITFEEEIDYFKNYLEIEEERFHDRLEVTVNVEDTTREIMVPTLMLQPLIENAFKHGIAQLEGKGTIELNAFIQDRVFIISLLNAIPADEVSSAAISTNIGLQNLESRLKQVYGKEYVLHTEKKANHFVVTIKINQT
jgi:two-component system LytT family sensor kinase